MRAPPGVTCLLQAGRLRMAHRLVAPTVGAVEAGPSRLLCKMLVSPAMKTFLLAATMALPPTRRLKLADRGTVWDGSRHGGEACSFMATGALASLFEIGHPHITALLQLQCSGSTLLPNGNGDSGPRRTTFGMGARQPIECGTLVRGNRVRRRIHCRRSPT